MSKLAAGVPNEAVIPSIETGLFDDNPSARFAVGMLAVGNDVMAGCPEEFTGYLRLRANVYADQTNMIPKNHVSEDGTERDEDDARSVHFAVIENAGRSQRVVGTMRLIVKANEDGTPLPIEEYFPEAFQTPAPDSSTEVSRYICRHEDPKLQDGLKWPLFSGALAHIIGHDLGPTYAVVEDFLEKDLQNNRVPIKRLAEPKFLEEYNYDNLAIVIATDVLARRIQARNPGLIETMREAEGKFTYFGTREPELERAA